MGPSRQSSGQQLTLHAAGVLLQVGLKLSITCLLSFDHCLFTKSLTTFQLTVSHLSSCIRLCLSFSCCSSPQCEKLRQ